MKSFSSIKRKYYKYGNNLDAVVTGMPIIDNAIISNFSPSNFLQFSKNFMPGNKSWEIKFKITTGSSVSGEYAICTFQRELSQTYRYATRLNVQSGKFQIEVSYNGTAWDQGALSTYTVQPNTTYYLKFIFTGTTYELSYSFDNVTFVTDGIITSSTPIYNYNKGHHIGVWNNGSYVSAFNGSIDLNESYIKIDNKLWWHGTLPEETTEEQAEWHEDWPDYSLSNNIIRKYYKYGVIPNIEIIGSPVISDGIVSGFNANSYLYLNKIFNISMANSWEINLSFTTGNSLSWHDIFGGARVTSAGNSCGALVDIYQNNLRFIVPFTASGSGIELFYGLAINTNYKIKAEFTGTNYNLYVNDSLVATAVDSRKGLYNSSLNSHVHIGNYLDISEASVPFNGSIDLTKSYVKIDNQLWWHGTLPEETTEEQAEWHEDWPEYSSPKLTTKIYYKYQYETWTRPNLIEDGVPGGKDYAAFTNSVGYSPRYAYRAFDLDNGYTYASHSWQPQEDSYPHYIGFYSPNPILCESLTVRNSNMDSGYNYAVKTYKVEASNDGVNWVTELDTTTNSNNSSGAYWTTPNLTSPIYARYRRLYATAAYYRNQTIIADIQFNNATKRKSIEATIDDYDYYIERDKEYLPIRHYYKWSTIPNATIVGTLTNDNGVFSGFSSSNYLQLQDQFRPVYNAWEYVICIKPNLTGGVIHSLNSASTDPTYNVQGWRLGINTNGTLYLYASTNSSSWSIASGTTSSNTLTADTWYWIKSSFSGSQYKVDVSTTGDFSGEEINFITVNNSTAIWQSNTLPNLIGVNGGVREGVTNSPINLTKSYIKINGEYWWHGTLPEETTEEQAEWYEDKESYEVA